jgi:aspartyl-tRNA(Asn)/glutamyl-tRNA(Gln) amidotransferase subunit C
MRAVVWFSAGPELTAMSIDSATVRRMAQLARIAVDDDELSALAGELNRLLELVDQLAAADAAGIEPMAHPHDQPLRLRPDNVTEADQAQALLDLAAQAQSGLYLVPKVIE